MRLRHFNQEVQLYLAKKNFRAFFGEVSKKVKRKVKRSKFYFVWLWVNFTKLKKVRPKVLNLWNITVRLGGDLIPRSMTWKSKNANAKRILWISNDEILTNFQSQRIFHHCVFWPHRKVHILSYQSKFWFNKKSSEGPFVL